MLSEEEFAKWLRRPEKTLVENLQFALKAWQSAEFTLTSKYEFVISWLVEEKDNLKEKSFNQLPINELHELLQLRAHPSLVTQQTKRDFVQVILNLIDNQTNVKDTDVYTTRTLPELLRKLNEFELLQDLFRSDYELQARLYGALLNAYESYVKQFCRDGIEVAEKRLLCADSESEFFLGIINTLNDHAKKAADSVKFEQFYTMHILQPLTQVLLVMRLNDLHFLDQFISIEQTLTENYHDDQLLKRILQLPMHVRLLALESSIVNRRNIQHYLVLVLQQLFGDVLKVQQNDKALHLVAAAYTLEIFRKHEVSLNFAIGNEPAFSSLGSWVLGLVQKHKGPHLKQVLMLLGAVLRLNPLILEQHVFQITTWMIVAVKNVHDMEEQQLYEEYLVLLMDMFRRLSRAEKFVINLLKALQDWLRQFKLPNTNTMKGTVKRKLKAEKAEITPMKKKRLSTSDMCEVDTMETLSDTFNFYLKMLFQNFYKNTTFDRRTSTENFPQLQYLWPSGTVGNAFSKLITGLVSKPSIVIWKTLLYSLKEVLKSLEANTQEFNENDYFNLELHSALICQYFSGSRLIDQADKYVAEITAQRDLTANTLGLFGRFLLAREHNKRIMNAFLECSYHAAYFELLLAYYRPDGCCETTLQPTYTLEYLHIQLNAEEWNLVQQRVLNFGNSSCKRLLNRLLLQRKEAQILLQPSDTTTELSLHKTLHSSTVCSDAKQIESLMQENNAKWLLTQLQYSEKTQIINTLLQKPDLHTVLVDDLASLDLVTLAIYEALYKTFKKQCKNSLFVALNCDFEKLHSNFETNNASENTQQFVDVLNEYNMDYIPKKLPLKEIKFALDTLQKLPVAHIRRQSKCPIFILHLALFCDLKAAHVDDLSALAFEQLQDFLHFGQKIPIMKYFGITTILQILPVASCWPFYEFLFTTIKNEEKGVDQFLTTLNETLNAAQNMSMLNDDYRRLTLIAIETLANINGPSAKRLRKHLDGILQVYIGYLNAHFKQSPSDNSSSKKDKKFVEKTIAGFASYINFVLAKVKSNVAIGASNDNGSLISSLDENFRRICKIYIGHSMDYRNPHAIRLIQVALNHRQELHLDQDEIEFVLSNYWCQLNTDLKLQQQLDTKSMEHVIKIIINNKNNENLLLTLKDIGTDVKDENFKNTARLLMLIAKCNFSTIKGAIFNEQFKNIIYDITARLPKDDRQQFTKYDQVLDILAAQQAIIENKTVPISLDNIDSILSFLMSINIKKFTITETNMKDFYKLHLSLSELCTALIKHRHILLMDRIPQCMYIFKDLLQAIVWYKSERQQDVSLSAVELENLSELAIKLEALMHIFATHATAVKRISPFILTFVINLMVASKRPTTLYPKIKTHIESICYDLIGISDHRVGNFILRCSNEASRQVYELLVKEHKKNYKFKGKV